MEPETTAADELCASESEVARALVLAAIHPDFRCLVLRPGEGPWTLGRADDCAFRLEDQRVSRHHARVEMMGPVLSFRDLGSRNGTYVNGSRTNAGPIGVGSIVRVGSFVLSVLKLPLRVLRGAAFQELPGGLLAGPSLRERLVPLERVAKSKLPILIEGETGTGKERTARFIHEVSGRRGAFQAINCAAVPSHLAESILFGHRAGAFTGAATAALGELRAADQGTLFLDEIEELPLGVQAKLLRALQEQAVVPLGAPRPVRVDLRLVGASQNPLSQAVEEGRFREDFWARLSGFEVALPPLRERVEEVPHLFRSFVESQVGVPSNEIPSEFIERLCLHQWPRNVRELKMVADRIVALAGEESPFRLEALPKALVASSPSARHGKPDGELLRLVAALRECAGNVTRASSKLGISRARAYRLMGGRSVDQVMGIADGARG